MFSFDWEPEYDRGSGVYETKHEPPRYVAYYEFTGGGSSRSQAYATREEAQADLDETIAFTEKLWRDRAKEASDPRVCVIDGHYYTVGDPDMSGARGFGGRQFYIARHDGTLIETTNLWFGGQIPEHWRDHIPNNAEFVSGERWVELDGVRYLAGGLG